VVGVVIPTASEPPRSVEVKEDCCVAVDAGAVPGAEHPARATRATTVMRTTLAQVMREGTTGRTKNRKYPKRRVDGSRVDLCQRFMKLRI
jgi:hypothetical protein